VDSPTAKLVGWGLFVLGLPALVTLWHFPEVRGAAPPGGLLGDVLASALTAAFNSVGGQVVTIAALLVALFLTTKFSFLGAQEWAKGPLAKINFIPSLMDRYHEWREAREQKQLRKRVEDIKISGRPAVASQVKEAVSKMFAKSAVAEEEEEKAPEAEDAEEEKPSRRSPVILRFKEKAETSKEELEKPSKSSGP